MSQKKETYSRARLERLISKKSATSGMTIRFNALSDEDKFDEELAILLKSDDLPEENISTLETDSYQYKKDQKLKHSSSLDSKDSSDNRSIFSELRGKITKTIEENWEHYRNSREKKDLSKDLTLKLRKYDSLPESTLEDSFRLNSEVNGNTLTSEADQNECLLDKKENITSENYFAAELPAISDPSTPISADKIMHSLPKKKKNTPPLNEDITFKLSSLLASTSKEYSEELEEAEEADVFETELKSVPAINVDPVVTSQFVPSIVTKQLHPITQTHSDSQSSHIHPSFAWAGIIVIFAYLICPLPSYVSGFIMGIFVTSTIGAFILWIFRPPPQKEIPSKIEPPSELYHMKISQPEGDVFKGWMNELPTEYNVDEYHINQTHSVYVRLQGSSLRLSKPKHNIPKRAMWDEPFHELNFESERYIDILGCRIILLPDEIAKKRLWSKKYPISIHINKGTKVVYKSVSQDKDEDLSSNKTPSVITQNSNGVIYLFTRTGREKEEWFRKLDAAAKGIDPPKYLLLSKYYNVSSEAPKTLLDINVKQSKRKSSDSSSSSVSTPESTESKINKTTEVLEFYRFMSQVIPRFSFKLGQDVSNQKSYFSSIKKEKTNDCDANAIQIAWVNAFLYRIFWDSLHDRILANFIQNKIQRKLDKIKVPYFMDELTITNIDMGVGIPLVHNISLPTMDSQGLWIDFELSYEGSFKMTLETKLNLMKLKKAEIMKPIEKELAYLKISKSEIVADSEVEDSAESSSDEEASPDNGPPTAEEYSSQNIGGGSTSKKILRFVDKLTQSKYFQQATEYKYIKRAMEGVSNTRLILTVEVQKLLGILSVNIPPPPTDRIWYGFRGNPHISLAAVPKFGDREVHITHVTEWIEKKLLLEFQKVFVMPNMDDLIIPVMVATDLPSAQQDQN